MSINYILLLTFTELTAFTYVSCYNLSLIAACKYRKGSWSACDAVTKVRTRTFTLKKGDANVCEATKTLRKECKGGKKGKDNE